MSKQNAQTILIEIAAKEIRHVFFHGMSGIKDETDREHIRCCTHLLEAALKVAKQED